MAIKIIENGKVEKLTLHSSDITVLDVANKFKDKNLESVITEISDTEHLHIGEVNLEKEGVWIEDNEILDSDESNGIVDRLKNYFSSIVGDLKTLTTNSKDTLVNAINENTNKVNQLSNPNLLINGDFQVWQRGTEFTNPRGYTADRWFLDGDTSPTAKKTENGITIATGVVGTWSNFYYTFEDNIFNKLVGKKLTLTFKTSTSTNDVALVWCNGQNSEGYEVYHVREQGFANGTQDTFSVTFEVKQKTTKNQVGIQLKSDKAGRTIELMWVKLELGEKTTPIIPRNYGEELALCQRYYQTHTPGGVANATNCLAIMSRLPVIMRINPTISYVPNSEIHEHGKGGVGTVEDITEVQCYTDRVDFIVTRQDYFTVGKAYNVGGICLDAEIY